ncbi:glucan endo-1,3-alpha-glucosidase agn1 [Colletotrichum truncatum]|uniref:Glucan endo-1,3-alpha-glucosidase agn1 n=1 Tax=Colletotrichum truncatum TaxID=5467 RepID=A0ACC3YC02_COLTU|nr:glucan endo-1,3-alpha-glucosidase agn1 [Colletotrichum truncatum]KAF6781621.1 glucan endo-1,3-alpha-glucosidase agn1 [Colletotrichum truncatum]
MTPWCFLKSPPQVLLDGYKRKFRREFPNDKMPPDYTFPTKRSDENEDEPKLIVISKGDIGVRETNSLRWGVEDLRDHIRAINSVDDLSTREWEIFGDGDIVNTGLPELELQAPSVNLNVEAT